MVSSLTQLSTAPLPEHASPLIDSSKIFFEKLIPKIPALAFRYSDWFLGICFELAGLAAFVQKVPHAVGLMLTGGGLITLSMARQSAHYIGVIRVGDFSPAYKRTLAYPKVLAIAVWAVVSWGFFRYAALNFEITSQWIHWILHY
jgi:hypothetical protein